MSLCSSIPMREVESHHGLALIRASGSFVHTPDVCGPLLPLDNALTFQEQSMPAIGPCDTTVPLEDSYKVSEISSRRIMLSGLDSLQAFFWLRVAENLWPRCGEIELWDLRQQKPFPNGSA